MAKGYWKAVLAAAFFIVAGVCYGGSLFREGSIVLEGETAAGGAGVQTADGAEGSGPWAGEGAGSPGTMEQKPVQIQKQKAPGQRLKGPGTLYISAAR